MKKDIVVTTILTLIVLTTVVYGFVDGGSPKAAKNRRFDEMRFQSIQTLKSNINSFYEKNKSLPVSLLEITGTNDNTGRASDGRVLHDPETNEEYQYKIISDKDYQLCATFATDTLKGSPQYLMVYAHPVGYHCFSFSGDRY